MPAIVIGFQPQHRYDAEMRLAENVEADDMGVRQGIIDADISQTQKTAEALHLCAANLAKGRELNNGCPVIHAYPRTGIRDGFLGLSFKHVPADDDAHDFIGAFEDLMHAQVPHDLFDAIL